MSPLLRIYAFRFATGFFPIAQLYSVMFVARGLSTFEISVLIASWSVAMLVFEVPSGVVADKFDRRYVLFAGMVFSAVAFLLWIASGSFWAVLAGFVLWGIAGALDSGTFEALLYDELTESGKGDSYVDVLGRTEAIYLVSVVVGSAYAAVFVRHGYDVLLWTSAIASLIAAFLALSLPSAAKREDVEDDKYFVLLRRGIKVAVRTPLLARIIMVVAVSGCVTDVVSEYAPLFAADQTITNAGIAIVGAVVVLAMAGASAIPTRIPTSNLPEGMQLVLASSLVVVATFAPMWPAVALFNLAAIIANTTWVLARGNMQHHVPSDVRATATSVAGFTQEVLNVAALVVVGAAADIFTRTDAFRWFAVVSIAVAFVLTFSTARPRRL